LQKYIFKTKAYQGEHFFLSKFVI